MRYSKLSWGAYFPFVLKGLAGTVPETVGGRAALVDYVEELKARTLWGRLDPGHQGDFFSKFCGFCASRQLDVLKRRH
jgi:hypothetical protein